MKPEDQRIAIAEALGWKRFDRSYDWNGRRVKCIQWEDKPGHPLPLGDDALPDYLNDLNACQDAAKILTEYADRCEYTGWLNHLTGHKFSWEATAAQHAEALLRTIGKWPPATA